MPAMRPTSDAVPVYQFSTEAFLERERVAAWQDIFGRAVVKLHIEPLHPKGFRSEATVCQLPGLGVLFVASDAMHLEHTHELVRDGELWLMAAPTCHWTASQLGRHPLLRPGDGVLMDNAQVGTMTLASPSRFTTLRVPTAAIAPLVPDLGAVVARRIPADNAALRLLVSYLASALDTGTLATSQLQQLAVTHIYDLLAVSLGATCDAAAIAEGRGVRTARLRALKADIIANIGRHDLSVGSVAVRQGITPSYIRKLLESEGVTFTELVLGQRLDRAHRMLADPRLADSTIASVAFAVGFGDLSYFNRAFRRRYGATPSDVRATEAR